MKNFRSRALCYGLLIVLGLLAALPNVLPQPVLNKLPGWYSEQQLTLGLDLRGGSHLLMGLDTQAFLLGEQQQLAEQLADALRDGGIRHRLQQVEANGIALQLLRSDPALVAEAKAVLQEQLPRLQNGLKAYRLDIDSALVRLGLTTEYRQQLLDDALQQSLEVLRRRLDESGLVEPSINRQGGDSILVQVPGVEDPQRLRQLLGSTAKMQFHWAANADSADVITLTGDGHSYRLEARQALDGRHLDDARQAFNPQTGLPVVNFKLDSEGARLFADMTRDNIGRVLAVVLDGKVITAPVIRSAIAGGSGEISGDFTTAQAHDLSLLLRAGALPAPLSVLEERSVGPDLGAQAIAMGIGTGLLGAALVLGFMLLVYGRWGVIACVGLSVNMALVFAVLTVLGATLTLPGIAGLVLVLGMAVDANILINERIREESRKGLRAYAAMDRGFQRAYGTILDSNITTLIAIGLLFLFGDGPIRGFSVTMAIGLLMSMFTAVSVNRLLMEWRLRRYGRRPLNIRGWALLDKLAGPGAVDVLRARFLGLGLSALLSLGALALLVAPGLHYGIDFSGGSLVEVNSELATPESLRSALAATGLPVAVQAAGGDGGDRYLLRLPMQGEQQLASGESVQRIREAVLSVDQEASFPRVEMVGPRVSGDFADTSILAVILAGGGMLIYLWSRFESHFALAAILTIGLDITKTLGFFVLAGVEFNLTAVAALLALIGYSVNDKVVVFDRVRENLRLNPDMPLRQLLNESIGATLGRTLYTSATTLLAILPMAVAGGAAVASFALPMLFGIVVGTSSSLFIAAPIVLMLGQRRLRRGLPQLRPVEELEAE